MFAKNIRMDGCGVIVGRYDLFDDRLAMRKCWIISANEFPIIRETKYISNFCKSSNRKYFWCKIKRIVYLNVTETCSGAKKINIFLKARLS